MARIRTIKPEFWSNDKLSDLPIATHFLAAAILNFCDDEGYFLANPRLLKSQIFPLREDSVNIHGMLIELSNIDYVRLMQGSDGRTYGHVLHFAEHQKVNRPSPSRIVKLLGLTTEKNNSLNTHG